MLVWAAAACHTAKFLTNLCVHTDPPSFCWPPLVVRVHASCDSVTHAGAGAAPPPPGPPAAGKATSGRVHNAAMDASGVGFVRMGDEATPIPVQESKSPDLPRATSGRPQATPGGGGDDGEGRFATFNEPNEQYGDNTIKTSKYTALSVVPRSLFEQFRRTANVYFLGISVLMIIGTYAPSVFQSPLQAYSTLGPLVLVLTITMVKEGVEDWKRHKSDREVNYRRCGAECVLPTRACLCVCLCLRGRVFLYW